MKRILFIALVLVLVGVGPVGAADWSNPYPRAGGDSAKDLLLKHEDVMTLMFSATTGYLNQLKSNFSGVTAPITPNTGQCWHDSTNNLLKCYNATWGGVGLYSSATSSFPGGIMSSGTNTWGGTQVVTGNINSSGTNTFSGTTAMTGTLTVGGNSACTALEIDGSAGTTLTAAQLLCGAMVSNYGQLASNVTITLPTPAANMGFVATVGTAQAANYWRFAAASSATMYTTASSTAKDYVQFAAPAVSNYFGCLTFKYGSGAYRWTCKQGNGTISTN